MSLVIVFLFMVHVFVCLCIYYVTAYEHILGPKATTVFTGFHFVSAPRRHNTSP